MNGWLTPDRMTDELPSHRCGKCANPFLGGRDDCPNNRIVMTDEQIADMLDDWSTEL